MKNWKIILSYVLAALLPLTISWGTHSIIINSQHVDRPRGAVASPHAKWLQTPWHKSVGVTPDHFSMIPAQLSYWGNSQYGCCVSAEEAFAKACHTPEVFIPPATLINFAADHGWLNGAALTSVMDVMISEGIDVGGLNYRDGPYTAVNYTNDAALSNAIAQGPVKIGVAANQLENTATSTSGWVATGFYRDQRIDHCVSLCGFGSLAQCCQMLGVPVPVKSDGNARAYQLFTWNTIGVIDRASLVAITGEAWLRSPTTIMPTVTPPAKVSRAPSRAPVYAVAP
jgi:hypothetical protein